MDRGSIPLSRTKFFYLFIDNKFSGYNILNEGRCRHVITWTGSAWGWTECGADAGAGVPRGIRLRWRQNAEGRGETQHAQQRDRCRRRLGWCRLPDGLVALLGSTMRELVKKLKVHDPHMSSLSPLAFIGLLGFMAAISAIVAAAKFF